VQEVEEVLGQENEKEFNVEKGEGEIAPGPSWNVGQEEKQDWPRGG
jgi:hypothetical protein